MHQEAELPFVSIIIPTRNEERFIAACLDSLITGTYPRDRYEIIVVDGLSDDRTIEIVESYVGRQPVVRHLPNPKHIVSPALNIGIRDARGEIVVRVDAHSLYATDYVEQSVRLLASSGAANVGGRQLAVGGSVLGEAIAVATGHGFGSGNARYKVSEREEWVDTVYLGAWRKETLVRFCGFDETWGANQDYELNCRLREVGGRILLSPAIRSQYHVRDSLPALGRQYGRYGYWRAKTVLWHPRSLRARQLVPPAALVVAVAGACGLAGRPIWLAVLGLGVVLTYWLIAAWAVRQIRGIKPWLVAVAFAICHFTWGIGFWTGLCRFTIPRVARTKSA